MRVSLIALSVLVFGSCPGICRSEDRLANDNPFSAQEVRKPAAGEGPFDYGNEPGVGVDPFGSAATQANNSWKTELSINGSTVLGSDLISAVDGDRVTLASGNSILLGADTHYFRRSGGDLQPVTRNELGSLLAIAYEIQLSEGAAASRIEILADEGPRRHQIYNYRNGVAHAKFQGAKRLKSWTFALQQPQTPLIVRAGEREVTAKIGFPQAIDLGSQHDKLELVNGSTAATQQPFQFSKIVVFRPSPDLAMITFFE